MFEWLQTLRHELCRLPSEYVAVVACLSLTVAADSFNTNSTSASCLPCSANSCVQVPVHKQSRGLNALSSASHLLVPALHAPQESSSMGQVVWTAAIVRKLGLVLLVASRLCMRTIENLCRDVQRGRPNELPTVLRQRLSRCTRTVVPKTAEHSELSCCQCHATNGSCTTCPAGKELRSGSCVDCATGQGFERELTGEPHTVSCLSFPVRADHYSIAPATSCSRCSGRGCAQVRASNGLLRLASHRTSAPLQRARVFRAQAGII